MKGNDMKEYLLVAYNTGTSELVDEYELEEKVQEIRDCGDMAVATEINYGEKVIDDATPYFKKLNMARRKERK